MLYQTELFPDNEFNYNTAARITQSRNAPSRSRTYNLLIRSQTLYPVALWVHGAEDRDRTGTVITYRGILSPVRLPIPPPRHKRKTGFEPATPTMAR